MREDAAMHIAIVLESRPPRIRAVVRRFPGVPSGAIDDHRSAAVPAAQSTGASRP